MTSELNDFDCRRELRRLVTLRLARRTIRAVKRRLNRPDLAKRLHLVKDDVAAVKNEHHAARRHKFLTRNAIRRSLDGSLVDDGDTADAPSASASVIL